MNSMLGTGRYRSTSALLGNDEYALDLISLEYEFVSPESWIDAGVLRAYYEEAEISQHTTDERGAFIVHHLTFNVQLISFCSTISTMKYIY